MSYGIRLYFLLIILFSRSHAVIVTWSHYFCGYGNVIFWIEWTCTIRLRCACCGSSSSIGFSCIINSCSWRCLIIPNVTIVWVFPMLIRVGHIYASLPNSLLNIGRGRTALGTGCWDYFLVTLSFCQVNATWRLSEGSVRWNVTVPRLQAVQRLV